MRSPCARLYIVEQNDLVVQPHLYFHTSLSDHSVRFSFLCLLLFLAVFPVSFYLSFCFPRNFSLRYFLVPITSPNLSSTNPMLNKPIQVFQLWLYTFSLILATLSIFCRLLARHFTQTRLQLNDWLMVLAYLNVLGLGIAANIGT